jgi:hypothetical protein
VDLCHKGLVHFKDKYKLVKMDHGRVAYPALRDLWEINVVIMQAKDEECEIEIVG